MPSPQNQPLNTLTPEALRDRKEFKKQLMEQIRAGGGASAFDSKQIFQGLVKDTIEAFLELEMEEHLGYAKHEPEGRKTAVIPAMAPAARPCAAISGKSR